MSSNQNPALYLATPVWRFSSSICALADGERHLGHIILEAGRWHAFDATHSNDESNGFRFVGSFVSVNAAKEAVSQSIRSVPLSFAGAA